MSLADPNTLLATSAQSGAALVAIVGGLLGSRFVALDADQQAAARRLTEATSRLAPARQAAKEAEGAWLEFQVTDLMDRQVVYEQIAQVPQGTHAQLDDVLEASELRAGSIPRNSLEDHLRLIESEIMKAQQHLERSVPLLEHLPTWVAFRRDHGIDPKHDGAWEFVYGVVAGAREKEAREARRQALLKSTNPFAALSYPDPLSLRVVASIPARGNDGWRTAKANRLVGVRDETARTVMILEAEEEAARVNLEDAQKPEGFLLAIQVLGVLALASIVFPTALMVGGPQTLPVWVRALVASAFVGSVGLLLRYLYVYAQVLSNRAARTTMPTGLVGLFTRQRDTQTVDEMAVPNRPGDEAVHP